MDAVEELNVRLYFGTNTKIADYVQKVTDKMLDENATKRDFPYFMKKIDKALGGVRAQLVRNASPTKAASFSALKKADFHKMTLPELRQYLIENFSQCKENFIAAKQLKRAIAHCWRCGMGPCTSYNAGGMHAIGKCFMDADRSRTHLPAWVIAVCEVLLSKIKKNEKGKTKRKQKQAAAAIAAAAANSDAKPAKPGKSKPKATKKSTSQLEKALAAAGFDQNYKKDDTDFVDSYVARNGNKSPCAECYKLLGMKKGAFITCSGMHSNESSSLDHWIAMCNKGDIPTTHFSQPHGQAFKIFAAIGEKE